jgi:hypothetical protein
MRGLRRSALLMMSLAGAMLADSSIARGEPPAPSTPPSDSTPPPDPPPPEVQSQPESAAQPEQESTSRRRRRSPSAAQAPAPSEQPAAVSPGGAPESGEAAPVDQSLPAPAVPFGQTLGYSGESPFGAVRYSPRPALALPDRWRIGWPTWDRYNRQAPSDDVFMNASGGDSPYTLGNLLNPYDRNVLKGDYPIAGQDIFLNASAVSDTFAQFRRLPTPSGVSAENSGEFDTFGNGRQLFVNQTFLLSLDLFKGYSAFRPVDWLIRVSGGWNINYLELQERNGVNIDPRNGDERQDDHFFLQEAFFEYHLGDTSPYFDFAATRVGRQLFVSDFRGFIYNDVGDGIRIFGNADSNRLQFNLAFLNQVEKDTNSELNDLEWRQQQVLIANLYIQDCIWKGYTTQFSVHWNHDQSDTRYDDNGFLVRPDLAGSVAPHSLDAVYLGWTGDGHIGRLNINHAMYGIVGHDDGNPLAGRAVDIAAYMGAVELSLDIDWLRPKVSFLYASGDSDPEDGVAGGFDGIVDNPVFAGGPSSFYQQSGLRLLGVNLVSARSLYNDLAGAKAEGQSNYVNPGTILVNAGLDAEITPKLRASLNANSIWFANTSTLELFLNQNDIDQHLGYELNLTAQYRPMLNNNVIITVGGSLFWPGEGFEDLYESDRTLGQVFMALTLTY